MYLSHLITCFFSSRRRHTRFDCDWSSDVCSSDLPLWLHRFESYPAHQKNVQSKEDRKSTRLNSSHSQISYAVFCLKKKKATSQPKRKTGLPPPAKRTRWTTYWR